MRIVYLCGALDEATRRARNIDAANPAATQKVFGFCRALRQAGHRAIVLSLGRGRQNGSGAAYDACARRADGAPVIYARFVHSRWTTHLVSAFSLAVLVWRLRPRMRDRITLIAYNRLWHYVPALLLARVLGMRCFLDLEDGSVNRGRPAVLRMFDRLAGRCFDALCNEGALLANNAVRSQTSIKRTLVWHGTTPGFGVLADWDLRPLGVILGGTLNDERGSGIFIEAVRLLMQQAPAARQTMRFFVTGHGPMCPALEQLAAASDGWVSFEGLVGRERYLQILGKCHVGLMLNLSSYDMGHITFPSKVLEYAAAGLLVISTDVSDVREVFENDAAVFLAGETPAALAAALIKVCSAPGTAAGTARRGCEQISAAFDPQRVANDIVRFFEIGN